MITVLPASLDLTAFAEWSAAFHIDAAIVPLRKDGVVVAYEAFTQNEHDALAVGLRWSE